MDDLAASLRRVAPVVPTVEPEPDPWVRVLAALDQLRAAIAEAPQPVVQVDAPDLTAMVNAVQALKGPATAQEIAAALADVLVPNRDPEPVGESLAAVAKALSRLEHRLQGVGTQAYGGGSVSFSKAGLNQLAGLLADTAATEVTPVTETVIASGDTTVYTPTSGKAVRLVWVSAINDPDEAASPLIKISLGGTELYRAYAVAHRQQFEGAVDAPLVVNLSEAASVAFTAHIQEF